MLRVAGPQSCRPRQHEDIGRAHRVSLRPKDRGGILARRYQPLRAAKAAPHELRDIRCPGASTGRQQVTAGQGVLHPGDGLRPTDEEPHRGRRRHLVLIPQPVGGGQLQRGHDVLLLTTQAQRRPTRHQHVEVGAGQQQVPDVAPRVEDVLEVVQDEERPPAVQVGALRADPGPAPP